MVKTEAKTRSDLIDTQLAQSGWNVKDPTQVIEEFDILTPLPLGVAEPRTPYEGHQFSDYVLLGKELGARSENPACYRQGKVQYDLLAKEPLFAQGLERLRRGLEKYQIALMCAEKDPLDCHRAVLVARRMFESGTPVQHIHADGHLEEHRAMEARMLQLHKMSESDMFHTREEILIDAYRIHGERIAYQDEAMLQEELREGSKQ